MRERRWRTFSASCQSIEGGNDDRHGANISHERPVDGLGKIGRRAGQPVAEHPVGIAAKHCNLTREALSNLYAIQAGKPVHVDSL